MRPQILDVACGSRMCFFDKDDPRVMFCDIRNESHRLCDGRRLEIRPDVVADFRRLPFADESFRLVLFDPPHLDHAGPRSWQGLKYGVLSRPRWREDLAAGFGECWRVLCNGGSLIFKWSETQISLAEALACFLPRRPVFGHTTSHKSHAFWMCFHKEEECCSGNI